MSFSDLETPVLVLRSNRGEEIASPYTDREAAGITSRKKFNDFAVSLVRDYRLYGDRLTAGKRFWLHKLAIEQTKIEAAQADAERLRLEAEEEAKYGNEPKPSNFEAVSSCRMPNIAEFLSRGRKDAVRGTRLRIENGPLTLLFRATERNKTRWPGGFLVLGVFGFARPDMPIARMDANGYLYWCEEARSVVECHQMFELFEADPVEFVLKYRGSSNNCCFCSKDLIDSVSVEVGYGPDCARMRGLPHDTATAQRMKSRREGGQMGCTKPE